jgi:hypothetical protein
MLASEPPRQTCGNHLDQLVPRQVAHAFIERRILGLCDDVRPGKPRAIDDERVAQLIKTTLHTKPFKWTATADSILEKLHRLCSRISGTGH